jgi:ABC-type Fe3+ transport system permease subunit
MAKREVYMENRLLLAMDVDGTAVGKSCRLGAKTKEAFHEMRRRGHVLCFDSGRHSFDMVNMQGDDRLVDYLITNSGGMHFTLSHFVRFFSRPYYSITLINSFKVSFMAALLSVLVGVTLGYFMSMYQIAGSRILRMCIVMATMSAPFVGAYAWIMLLGRSGVITRFLSGLFGITMPDIYGFNGILLVFTTQLFPLVFLYVQGAMSKMDASLLEAAENMGCTGVKRFLRWCCR